jgi:DNA mismatch endonuclease (patch repair protein)
MADVHSKETRSYNMSRIKSKDTKPELLVRKFLHKNGFRYRLHVKDMPGKPDIVLPKYKTVIFVHGCFWHGHEGCKKAALPETRKEWWRTKINYNIKNGVNAEALLKAAGWNVITIWQCDMKNTFLENTFHNLLKNLRQIS